MTSVAEGFVTALTVYAGLGLVFAVLFVTVGIHRVDHQAKGSGAGFRLIILPGVATFWPLLLTRWICGVSEPPVESNEHRKQAMRGGTP